MKIGFVGAGRVGSLSAYACLTNMDLNEIALVDIAEDLAVGEAIDLSHAGALLGKFPKIVGGTDYSLLKGSEVIVVTAGFARKPGMTRLDLATKNVEVMREVVKNIVKHSKESKILVVTNPMDLMTYVAWRESGKKREEVFGMGSLLDSARLMQRLNSIGIRSGKAWIIGEHGDSMFIAEGLAEVKANWEQVEKEVRQIAAEVIKRKGATVYGPGTAVYRMVKAVVEDTGEIIPTSVVLNGEYGIKDVALGVPARLSKNGAEVVELELSEKDLEKLRNSAEILKKWIKDIGY
ncbi:MAG: malate dehydrogenase [Archaeoglobaceae archaeon]